MEEGSVVRKSVEGKASCEKPVALKNQKYRAR